MFGIGRRVANGTWDRAAVFERSRYGNVVDEATTPAHCRKLYSKVGATHECLGCMAQALQSLHSLLFIGATPVRCGKTRDV